MQYTSAQIDSMLAAPMGQAAIIDDGSLGGLQLQCKFVDPQEVLLSDGVGVEASVPSCKIKTAAVADLDDLRGRLVTIGTAYYRIQSTDPRRSGLTILYLEDES